MKPKYNCLGIPSLDLIPIDPLRIVELVVDQNKGHPINLNIKFTDFDIYNIKYVQFKNMK